jgi:hypothetical protein
MNSIRYSFFGKRRMNNDDFWKKSIPLTAFTFPWEEEFPPAMIFRAQYDTKNLYFRFDVIDSDIIVNTNSSDKMAVLDSDRVEIFFRSDERMKPYYCLEMDPKGRVLDYKAEFKRNFDFKWRWEGLVVRSEYTLNGYRVWGCIPLSALESMKLLNDHTLQVGIFRGKCIIPEGNDVDFKWISWVKPESELPDFHIPSAFGELKF